MAWTSPTSGNPGGADFFTAGGNSLALGSTSGGLTVNSGTLDLTGNNATVGALQSTQYTGVVASSTGPAVLTAGAGNATSVFNGLIDDGVGVVKTGSGMLALAGTNSYTGGTTVSGGTVAITGAGNIGSGNVAIGAGALQTTGAVALENAIQVTNAGSTLNVPGALDTLILDGPMTGGGALNKAGAGTLALAETSGDAYSGATNVLQGTLLVGAGQCLVARRATW